MHQRRIDRSTDQLSLIIFRLVLAFASFVYAKIAEMGSFFYVQLREMKRGTRVFIYILYVYIFICLPPTSL